MLLYILDIYNGYIRRNRIDMFVISEMMKISRLPESNKQPREYHLATGLQSLALPLS